MYGYFTLSFRTLSRHDLFLFDPTTIEPKYAPVYGPIPPRPDEDARTPYFGPP